MRWKLLFSFYFKQMIKSKLYLGAWIFSFLLFIFRIILYFATALGIEKYGDLPGEAAGIVQIVSIFYIVYFYRIFSNELLYGVHTYFVDGYRILLEKMSALFVCHVLFQGIFLAFTYGLFSGIYLGVGVEISSIYLSLLRFMIVYLFVPLIFCPLYGFIAALLIPGKKVSFLAILFFWIATGSMNSQTFEPFFDTVQANDWKSLLLIGVSNLLNVYDPYIGFDISWGIELKLIAWSLLLVGLILYLSLRYSIQKKERKYVLPILAVFSIAIIGTSYTAIPLHSKAFKLADYTAENDYYLHLKKPNSDIRYEIESYEISLKNEKVTAIVTFSELNTEMPTFQLYYAYPIRSIKADNKQVQFERDGDIVTVHLPNKVSSLTFHYDIVDTNFVPYVNGRVALLADKAWYPKKRTTHIFEPDVTNISVIESEDVFPNESYQFTVNVEGALFCNLPKQGEVYQGEAQAVTVIIGQGNQLTYDGYHITYPADWPKMKERVPVVLEQLEITLQDINQIVDTPVQSLPKSIVFSNYGLSSFMTKDHLVYNTGYGDPVNAYDVMKDFPFNMLSMLVERKGSYIMFEEWKNLTSIVIRQKNDWYVDAFDGIPLSISKYSIPKSEEKLIEVVYDYFFQLNGEEQKAFIQEWYRQMDENLTWDDIIALVKEWK